MSRIFRRALSTSLPAYGGPSSAPPLPLAVRRRQELYPATHKPSPLSAPEKFVGEGAEQFPFKLEEEFQWLRARGHYAGEEDAARLKFLEVLGQWRSRVRGGHGRANKVTGKAFAEGKREFFAREGKPREQYEEDNETFADAIVGQKVYLPNIQIRLVRNATAPGEAYNPFMATFRIPPSMTKNDLRSYLHAAYGLDVTYIRTDLYVAPVVRTAGGRLERMGGNKRNYKRAVVGLKEPFHYPDDVDEMRAGTWGGLEEGAKQAAERDAVIQGEYAIDQTKDYRKHLTMKMHKGWRWRSDTHDNAGNTVREIMRRRQEREDALYAEARDFRDRARRGEFVQMDDSILPLGPNASAPSA